MKRPSFRFLISRKFWQRTAFLLACLATLIAAAYALENYRGQKAWQSYRAEAEARGAKLDWEDFIPAPIPDQENFAALPIYRELLSSDPAIRSRYKDGVNLPSQYSQYIGGPDRRGSAPDLPALQKCFVEGSLISTPTDDPVADLLHFLDRYEPVLAQLRAASDRPRSRLDAGWKNGYDAAFWHLGDTLSIYRIASLRVSCLLASGRSQDAATDWHAGYRHAGVFQGEPTLLAGMLRVMLIAGLTTPVWEGLERHAWSDAELSGISTDLGTINLMADFTFAMSSERALMNFTLGPLMENPGRWGEQTRSDFQKPPKWSWAMLIPKGWFGQNQRRLNQWYDRQIAAASHAEDHPATDASIAPLEVSQSWLRFPYWFVVRSAAYMLGDNLAICRQTQTDVDLARVACALERFRLRNGEYPARLEELAPAFLPKLPRDRYDGQPLRYHPTEDRGLVLYSIGKDQRDDGGDQEKDLVWRAALPPGK